QKNTSWYWSEATRVRQVADNLTLTRFEQLKHNLHFVDNGSLGTRGDPDRDRLVKIRPLVDA
ncbi:hypothetical protein HPB47_003906, partial [Ixodes persulcatus]